MRAWRAIFATAILLLAARALVFAQAGAAPVPVFQVDFSDPALSPSHWTLTIHPDGSGHFHSEQGMNPEQKHLDAPNVDRDIRLSARFAQRIFAVASHRNWSQMGCESTVKVAFMGWKKFSYSGPEGQGSCQFNYASDKDIQALEAAFMAVAETILKGARLEMLLQHDRLGLDQEMESLVHEANEGQAQQLVLIHGILQRLAEDTCVLERVRKRARALLAKAEE